jgi:hypothetical protein
LQRLLDDEVPAPGERRHVAGLKARLEAERGASKTAGAMKRALEALSEEMGYGGAINDEVVAEGQRRLSGGMPPFGAAPRPPATKCPKCGKPVWDKAGADQRLNKCWECGLRFDTRPAREADEDPEGGEAVSRYHDAVGRTGPGTPATGTGRECYACSTRLYGDAMTCPDCGAEQKPLPGGPPGSP